MEIINPTNLEAQRELIEIAKIMMTVKTDEFEVAESVIRGLDYYTENGFEISAPKLGSQKQVVGGGTYKQGIGFALGFDRLMLC